MQTDLLPLGICFDRMPLVPPLITFVAGGLARVGLLGWARRRPGAEWTIASLQAHAESRAKVWRVMSGIGMLPLMIYGWTLHQYIVRVVPCVSTLTAQEVTLELGKLSALVLTAALLILVVRMLWNYANVWLGRAGTLEDLGLLLALVRINPKAPTGLLESETHQLVRLAEAFERLRRSFEGDLLKGPAFDVPQVGK